MMLPVHVERLRTLYSILAGIPDEKFDLSSWRWDYTRGESCVNDADLLNGCGTSGCAVGFAAAYPPFIAEGFKMVAAEPALFGRKKTKTNWSAVEKFFGLTDSEAIRLFSGDATGCEGRAKVMTAISYLLYEKGFITSARYAKLLVRIAEGKAFV